MKIKLRSSLFFCLPVIFSGVTAQAGVEETARAGAKGISKVVQYAADQIDVTLAGKRYVDRANDSRATLSLLQTWTEGGVFKTSTDFGVNVRLPNFEKHWQLRFSTYDEEKEERDMNQRYVKTSPRPREYGTSLFFLQKLGDVKVTFQPKLQLKDPLDMSYVLRFESAAEQKRFRIAPKLELFADATKGTGEFVSLAFIYRIRKTVEIALENEEEYREKDNFFTTRHGLTLDYAPDKWNSYGTALIFSSENHEFHLTNISYSVSYNRVIYRNLLNASLTPFWNFAKGDHFKGKVGIAANLVAIF